MTDDPLAAIDEDLAAACIVRLEAFRDLAIKDSPDNRQAYAISCAEVDALLDMRHEMALDERMVSP
jgi:hypothetical protein